MREANLSCQSDTPECEPTDRETLVGINESRRHEARTWRRLYITRQSGLRPQRVV